VRSGSDDEYAASSVSDPHYSDVAEEELDAAEMVGERAEEDAESTSESEQEIVEQVRERRQNLSTRDHRGYPPTLNFEFSMLDLDFHPTRNMIALAGVTGDTLL
jgi:hypothetical protein